MHWHIIIVLALLVGYVVSETFGPTLKEGFSAPLRSDIGPASEGWTEYGGYVRDLRYTETFVDIQGTGTASDFCRAVARQSDPKTLRISCALGQRDGMDTMEYNSKSLGEGFRFSRDDYWRFPAGKKRMDYCRILKDVDTGDWFAGCAVAGLGGFKDKEVIDVEPPAPIQKLLEAYDGILTWFRWLDDRDDYAGNAVFSVKGIPTFPSLLKPELSRGLELNRAKLLTDYLVWGEPDTLELHQTIQPRQIRSIACWIWWDAIEKGATIVECSNETKTETAKDRFALGVDGGGPALSPARLARSAQELRPEVIQLIGQITEPAVLQKQEQEQEKSQGTYYFEIWDNEQRIMRLDTPMGSAKVNQWQHVAVTVTDETAWWPTWQFWIDGELVGERTDGRLSPAMELKHNTIGKNVRGCIQDFRIYSKPMTAKKIADAIAWSGPKLHPSP